MLCVCVQAFVARKEAQRAVAAALTLQKYFRGQQGRKLAHRVHTALLAQACTRGLLARAVYTRHREAAVLLQSVTRGYLAFVAFARLKKAAITVCISLSLSSLSLIFSFSFSLFSFLPLILLCAHLFSAISADLIFFPSSCKHIGVGAPVASTPAASGPLLSHKHVLAGTLLSTGYAHTILNSSYSSSRYF